MITKREDIEKEKFYSAVYLIIKNNEGKILLLSTFDADNEKTL